VHAQVLSRYFVCVKRDLVCVKRDLVCVKRDLVCACASTFEALRGTRGTSRYCKVSRYFVCVKRDLVCVKRDLVCVKRDLVCACASTFEVLRGTAKFRGTATATTIVNNNKTNTLGARSTKKNTPDEFSDALLIAGLWLGEAVRIPRGKPFAADQFRVWVEG
jgi:hypothetical protein